MARCTSPFRVASCATLPCACAGEVLFDYHVEALLALALKFDVPTLFTLIEHVTAEEPSCRLALLMDPLRWLLVCDGELPLCRCRFCPASLCALGALGGRDAGPLLCVRAWKPPTAQQHTFAILSMHTLPRALHPLHPLCSPGAPSPAFHSRPSIQSHTRSAQHWYPRSPPQCPPPLIMPPCCIQYGFTPHPPPPPTHPPSLHVVPAEYQHLGHLHKVRSTAISFLTAKFSALQTDPRLDRLSAPTLAEVVRMAAFRLSTLASSCGHVQAVQDRAAQRFTATAQQVGRGGHVGRGRRRCSTGSAARLGGAGDGTWCAC